MNGKWASSNRKARLPANWPQLRRQCFAIYGRACYLCGGYATDVDHVVPGDNHTSENLRPICPPCHKRKSSAEGGRAYQRIRPKRQRPSEPHPGVIRRG